jgi:hypothetical protein
MGFPSVVFRFRVPFASTVWITRGSSAAGNSCGGGAINRIYSKREILWSHDAAVSYAAR